MKVEYAGCLVELAWRTVIIILLGTNKGLLFNITDLTDEHDLMGTFYFV